MYTVDFNELPWENTSARRPFKAISRDGKKLRIAEFTSEFVEPHWCEKGHIGIVLSGELEIDFKGRIVRYPEGTNLYSRRTFTRTQSQGDHASRKAVSR